MKISSQWPMAIRGKKLSWRPNAVSIMAANVNNGWQYVYSMK